MSAYGNLSLEQKGVLQALLAYGQREGRPAVFVAAAVFTALREQNLRNQPYGSGTSLGWRQEIEGKGTPAQRMSLAYSIPHFYRECAEIYQPGMAANVLAERVQRPEKPYPEQAQSLALAETLIRESPAYKGNFAFGPAPGQGSTLQPTSPVVIIQQPDPQDRTPKIRASGKQLSASGTAFGGHANALHGILMRTVRLKA